MDGSEMDQDVEPMSIEASARCGGLGSCHVAVPALLSLGTLAYVFENAEQPEPRKWINMGALGVVFAGLLTYIGWRACRIRAAARAAQAEGHVEYNLSSSCSQQGDSSG